MRTKQTKGENIKQGSPRKTRKQGRKKESRDAKTPKSRNTQKTRTKQKSKKSRTAQERDKSKKTKIKNLRNCCPWIEFVHLHTPSMELQDFRFES